MAIQFDGLQLADLSVLGLPSTPAAGEVAFDGALRVYSGVAWETFNPVDPSGDSSTINMAASAVIAADSGSGGAPSYTFGADSTLGMFYAGSDTIGLVGGGGAITNFAASSTPVNFWQMESSDAASPVELKALGGDTDIDMLITPKGDGVINVPSGYKDRANFGTDSLATKEYVDTFVAGGFVANPMVGDLDVGSNAIVGTPGSTSAGGDVDITAGDSDGAFDGGAVNITGGSSANDSGDGGGVTLTGGDGFGPSQDGGDITLIPGGGSGSGVDGTVRLDGVLTWTPTASARQIRAAAAGDTEVGAALTILGQDNASGAGGDVTLTAGDGGTIGDGGDIVLNPGALAGSGVVGTINMGGDIDLQSNSLLHVVDIYRATKTDTDTVDLTFTAQDSGDNDHIYGKILTEIGLNTDSNEDGKIHFDVSTNGSLLRALTLNGNFSTLPRVEVPAFLRVSANVQPMLELHNSTTAGSDPEIWFRKNDAGAVVRFGGKISCAFVDTTSDSVDTAITIQTVKDNTTVGNVNDLTWDENGILHLERDKGGSGASSAEVRLYEAPTNGTEHVGFKAPADMDAAATGDGDSVVWTLPEGDGTAGQVMKTSGGGGGVLSWQTVVTNPMSANLDLGGYDFITDDNSNEDFKVTLGDETSNQQRYGVVEITAGSSTAAAGPTGAGWIKLFGGNHSSTSGSHSGGHITLEAGDCTLTTSGLGGNVNITAGNGGLQGGVIYLNPGEDTGDNSIDGYVIITSPNSSTKAPDLRLKEADSNGNDYMGLKAPDSVATSNTFEMAPKVVNIDNTDSPYTVDEDEDLIVVDASSGNVVINLHSAANERFRELNIKRTDASGTYTVTIDRAGSDTIDGATSYVIPISSQWANVSLLNDKGTAWYVL